MSDSGGGEGWTRVEQEVLDEDRPPVDASVAGLYSPTARAAYTAAGKVTRFGTSVICDISRNVICDTVLIACVTCDLRAL